MDGIYHLKEHEKNNVLMHHILYKNLEIKFVEVVDYCLHNFGYEVTVRQGDINV